MKKDQLCSKILVEGILKVYNKKEPQSRNKLSKDSVYRIICALSCAQNAVELSNFINKLEKKSDLRTDLGLFVKGRRHEETNISALIKTPEFIKEFGDILTDDDVKNSEKQKAENRPKNEESNSIPSQPNEKIDPRRYNFKRKFTTEEKVLANFNMRSEKTEIGTDIHKAVLLIGPAGTGKTTIAKQIAKKKNWRLKLVPKAEFSEDLTGYRDSSAQWVKTVLYKAIKEPLAEGEKGTLVMFDELDTFGSSALVAINNLLSQGEIVFDNETCFIPENFYVLCASNTVGLGADEVYTGRVALDGATLNRFAYIFVDYDKNVELEIAEGNDQLVDFCDNLRRCCEKLDIKWLISYRNIEGIQQGQKLLGIDEAMRQYLFKFMLRDPSAVSEVLGNLIKLPGNVYEEVFRDIATEIIKNQ